MRLKLNDFRKSNPFILRVIVLASIGGVFLTACTPPSTTETETTMGETHERMMGGDPGRMDHGLGMELGAADQEYDLRFIDAMIPHHQGAIMMAEDALEKSERPEIQELAQEIISAQEEEIAQLREWRQGWYPDAPDTPVAYDAEMGQSMPMTAEQEQMMMMSMDLGAADEEYDLRFIQMMIPHHVGAVEMAEDALEKSQRPEIQKLAQEISAAQEEEISQMRQWRQEWYGI